MRYPYANTNLIRSGAQRFSFTAMEMRQSAQKLESTAMVVHSGANGWQGAGHEAFELVAAFNLEEGDCLKYALKTEVIQVVSSNRLLPCLPEGYELVEIFLSSEVQDRKWSGSFFLDAIEKVLSGQESAYSIGGNVIGLRIWPDRTEVVDTLSDEEEEPMCEIETLELKQLLLAWLVELEKFKQEQEKE